MTARALQRAMGGVLAVLLAGCGLSDYESLMRTSQDRIKRFSEESEVLGDPITVPTKRMAPPATAADSKASGKDSKTAKDTKSVKDPPKTAKDTKSAKDGGKVSATAKEAPKEVREAVIKYPFFLRLPKGLRTTADLEPKFELVYRYPRTGVPALSAKVPPNAELPIVGSASGIPEVYLAFGNDPQAAFVDKVARLLPRSGDVMGTTASIEVPDRKEPLSFDVREFNDSQSAWAVYAHGENSTTVAIIYRMEKAQKDSLKRIVEMSLASLAMGSEASSVASSYAHRPK
jgi:hypothetical protein